MRYLSVCSGIEAATVAWHPLGWEPAAFAEIEPFPRAVLKHHYPKVPLHGDFTAIQGNEHGAIDLLVGGTPCQSFSVAGLREGLADYRGNLALEFLRLAQRARPRWVVWENVPGVLSSRGGRDFGSILGGLVELGYGYAYRVLDAQYFGVAQRRRRVFVVGCLGDWRRAAAVLFERDCLSGNPAPSREARKGTAEGAQGRSFDGGVRQVAATLDATMDRKWGSNQWVDQGFALVQPNPVAFRWQNDDAGIVEDSCAATLRAKGTTTDERSVGAYVTSPMHDPNPALDASYSKGTGERAGIERQVIATHIVSPALNTVSQRFNHGVDTTAYVTFHPTQDPISSTDGTTHAMGTGSNSGQASIAVAFSCKDYGGDATSDLAPTLRSMGHDGSHANGGGQVAVGFYTNMGTQGGGVEVDKSPTLKAGSSSNNVGMARSMAVRRLTPRECERLQGFPDDYTAIPWRGKEAPDGPRYKALGNSMAVPVMRWIGERIKMVDA